MPRSDKRAVTVRRVTLTGGRHVHIREWPGDGAPLVLLHGLLSCSASWTPFAEATRRHCVAVDLPGFGLSGPPGGATVAAFAADVAEALASLGLAPGTVVGHSLGGAVAVAMAERMQERVAGLVLCAPAGFGRLARAELAALPLVRHLAAGALPRLLTSSLLAGMIGASLVRFGLSPSADARHRLAAEIARAGPGACAAVQALAIAGRSPTGFHRRTVAYRGPVSAVWGECDPLIPPIHAERVRVALPQAELHIWAGAGHPLHRERPSALAALAERVGSTKSARSAERCRRRPPRAQRRPRSDCPAGITPRGSRLLAGVRRASMLPHELRHGRADDDALLDWLSQVAAVVDPPPARVAELARAAFAATRQPAWEPPRRARSAPTPRRPCPEGRVGHRVA